MCYKNAEGKKSTVSYGNLDSIESILRRMRANNFFEGHFARLF